MDLNELVEVFNDNDEEIIMFIQNLRTYTIRERPDHFNIWSDDEFFNRFRFKKDTIRNLLPQIEEYLRHNNEQYHEIGAAAQLLLTIRFYATGQFYIATGDFGGIHKTTAGRIISRVTNALVTLRPRLIRFPDDEEGKNQIKAGFYGLAQFPNVIGAIDGTHIPIQSRGGPQAEVFRNRKGYFSLNVQVICDSQNRILDIVSRWPGSAHDSHMFRNSSIRHRFENGEFNGSVLLGDSAYPLSNYLMTPIPNPNAPAEHLYNRSHLSTRTIVERTIGIWKRRFAVLFTKLRCNLVLVQRIILATAVLHNVAVNNRDDIADVNQNDDVALPEGDQENQLQNNHVLQTYVNYFHTLL